MQQCFVCVVALLRVQKQSETNDLHEPKPAAWAIGTQTNSRFVGCRLESPTAAEGLIKRKLVLIGSTEMGQVAPGFNVLQRLFSFLLWTGAVSCFFPSKPHLAFYGQVPQRGFIWNSRDAPQKHTMHRFHLCWLIITLSGWQRQSLLMHDEWNYTFVGYTGRNAIISQ